ncbi:MAG: hypothetical protein IT460_03065 [Planctomycetes bacterium]|nr:hypothetical protein [Planctomycetota bacterium]
MTAPTFHGLLKADASAPRKMDLRLDGDVLHGGIDGAHVEATVARGTADGEVVLRVGDRRVRAHVVRDGARWLVAVEGAVFQVARVDHVDAADAGGSSDPFAASPMTGVVTKVHVRPGDAVGKGAPLFAVEAMKMEYVVKAERDVAVVEVKKAAGARVAVGEVVVTFAE